MNTYSKTPSGHPAGGPAGHGAGSHQKRILVAISGGCHSAVAAAILKSQGHWLQAVHFQAYDPNEPAEKRFGSRCCLNKSFEAAQQVCRKLDIPLHQVHVEAEFRDKVVDTFIHDILLARLPNPCVPCNRDIRFEALFAKARALGCEQVATGHHVQVMQDAPLGGRPAQARLLQAVNEERDQSYFLYGMDQKMLGSLLTPVGGFQDVMVSRLAREFELPQAGQPDQQEVCFLKGDRYKTFVQEHTADTLRPRGNIRLADGTVVGEHNGLYAYQLGQEPKLHQSIKEKYQVVGFDVPSHALIVGHAQDTLQAELRATQARWIRPINQMKVLRCQARMSPSQRQAIPCQVSLYENNTVRVTLEQPQTRMIAGQPIVFYDGPEVLGGALIEAVGSEPRDE